MIETTHPKSNRFKYAATVLGALAVAATPLACPAVANAQPVLDVESYDKCVQDIKKSLADGTIHLWDVHNAYVTCCEYAGGTWSESRGDCAAPPPADSKGSRQLPGNVHIPSDIATAPTVTKDPPRSIRVPSDIATVSTVSQGDELAS
jgi:hypothetical protein